MDMYNVVFLNGFRLGVLENPYVPYDKIIRVGDKLFTSDIYRFILKTGASDFDKAVDDCICFAINKLHGEMDRKLEIQRRMLDLEKGINFHISE